MRTSSSKIRRVSAEPSGGSSGNCTPIRSGPCSLRCGASAAACSIPGEQGLRPFHGDTDLFIVPGFDFKVVDALLTNFHLPQSSLLMLVCAFAGKRAVLDAYAHAVAQGYRFYSYGDAMFIEPPTP